MHFIQVHPPSPPPVSLSFPAQITSASQTSYSTRAGTIIVRLACLPAVWQAFIGLAPPLGKVMVLLSCKCPVEFCGTALLRSYCTQILTVMTSTATRPRVQWRSTYELVIAFRSGSVMNQSTFRMDFTHISQEC